MNEPQTVVVTGSSRGWGKAVALRYAAPGTRIFVNYVQNEEAALETVDEVNRRGGTGIAVMADMGTEKGVSSLFEQVKDHGGDLDVLVYNAFHKTYGRPLDISIEDLEQAAAVGPWGYLRCIQQAVPLMGERGGAIVCTGSVASRRLFSMGGTGYFPMAVVKGGEEVMTRYLAADLGPSNITVNMVIAGWIDTEFVVETFTEDRRRRINRKTPLGRFASPEDMANVVHFLGSPEGSWITGQIITADGGLTII
jgi:NAD(P)-dependent dehydrogenase (short-subunit alcohol dehydrogenase family)